MSEKTSFLQRTFKKRSRKLRGSCSKCFWAHAQFARFRVFPFSRFRVWFSRFRVFVFSCLVFAFSRFRVLPPASPGPSHTFRMHRLGEPPGNLSYWCSSPEVMHQSKLALDNFSCASAIDACATCYPARSQIMVTFCDKNQRSVASLQC